MTNGTHCSQTEIPNRNCPKFLVNGKRPQFLVKFVTLWVYSKRNWLSKTVQFQGDKSSLLAMDSHILCIIFSFKTSITKKVFYTPGLNSLGQLIML